MVSSVVARLAFPADALTSPGACLSSGAATLSPAEPTSTDPAAGLSLEDLAEGPSPAASKNDKNALTSPGAALSPGAATLSPVEGPPLDGATPKENDKNALTSPGACLSPKNATPAHKKKARPDSIHKSAMKNLAAKVALEVLLFFFITLGLELSDTTIYEP